MLQKIKEAIQGIKDLPEEKRIRVVSHFDTDGITSAAIFARVLQFLDKKFTLEIVKNLEREFIEALPEEETLIFLDLASNSLDTIGKRKEKTFIFDHHQIIQEIPSNVFMVNPENSDHEPLSSSAICYLVSEAAGMNDKNLGTLAVLGMVGDNHEKEISKTFDEILKKSETTLKKGLLLYPSTRPLDRALEYASSLYIPNVTGSRKGVLELLREAGIQGSSRGFKALYELTEEEMSNLITAIMIKSTRKSGVEEMIGNLFLVKFFNKVEDARELSALINACSRMGHPEVALGFCLGNKSYKTEGEKIYINYKQNLVSALKYVSESEKILGRKYTIINAQDQIKDTIIGTVASILSHSTTYEEGTIIVALAYNQDKIKVSARIAGREGRNVREVLNKVVVPLGGEVGGHPKAAGCLISKDQEETFLEELKKTLEVDHIKIN